MVCIIHHLNAHCAFGRNVLLCSKLALNQVMFVQECTAVCQPAGIVLKYLTSFAYIMINPHAHCSLNSWDWALVFGQISHCFENVVGWNVCWFLAEALLSMPLTVLDYPLGFRGDQEDMLMQICLSPWRRTAPARRETHPLTPARHEIIEPCSVPDCMLSWRSPNLFHSLRRGFVCRKRTDWAVPGGMTSMLLLLCWCHRELWMVRSFPSLRGTDTAKCFALHFSINSCELLLVFLLSPD